MKYNTEQKVRVRKPKYDETVGIYWDNTMDKYDGTIHEIESHIVAGEYKLKGINNILFHKRWLELVDTNEFDKEK